jgi:hypothetical protein
MDRKETERRYRRKGSYHLVGSKSKLPLEPDELDYDYLFQYLLDVNKRNRKLFAAKRAFLQDLALSEGDTTTESFHRVLDNLIYASEEADVRFDARAEPSKSSTSPPLEGMWLSLSKAIFSDCLGVNSMNQPMYTMGRMSFDIFKPSHLVCSLQGIFNPIHVLDPKDVASLESVPTCFQDEIRKGNSVIRTYNTVCAFTIEQTRESPSNSQIFGVESPNLDVYEPIQGLMTTYGYAISNPHDSSQLSIWFTGGSLEVHDVDGRLQQWKRIFEDENRPKRKQQAFWKRRLNKARDRGISLSELEEDGKMTYSIMKPFAGHDRSYINVLYMDETLLVTKANTGPIYVSARVPVFPDE